MIQNFLKIAMVTLYVPYAIKNQISTTIPAAIIFGPRFSTFEKKFSEKFSNILIRKILLQPVLLTADI